MYHHIKIDSIDSLKRCIIYIWKLLKLFSSSDIYLDIFMYYYSVQYP